jgi:type IV fimbrial biogenesis protein FimT
MTKAWWSLMKRQSAPIAQAAASGSSMTIDLRQAPRPQSPGRSVEAPARVAGYTILELMIVVTIVAVLASIAVPNLLAARAGFQISSAGSTAVNRLGEARMEALKRNRYVTVTLDPANRSMTTTTLDDVGQPMTIAGPEFMPSDVVFEIAGAPFLAIQFDSMGRPVNPPQTFTLRHTRSDQRRVLTISSTGRLTVEMP